MLMILMKSLEKGNENGPIKRLSGISYMIFLNVGLFFVTNIYRIRMKSKDTRLTYYKM